MPRLNGRRDCQSIGFRGVKRKNPETEKRQTSEPALSSDTAHDGDPSSFIADRVTSGDSNNEGS
jgi:hypothetical protein